MRTPAPQTPAFAVPETRTWRAIRVVPLVESEEGAYGRPERPTGRAMGREPTLRVTAALTPATTGPADCDRSGRSGGREALDVVDSDGWNARPKRRIRTAR